MSITELKDESTSSPFTVIGVEVIPSIEQAVLDPDDPILLIKTKQRSDTTKIFEDNESNILQEFSNHIISKDPDIIVFKNYDLSVLNYFLKRTKAAALDLQLGRRKIDIYSSDQTCLLDKWGQGRIYITEREFNQYGIAGLIELSKFSHLPIRYVLNYSIGRLIANRNFYELLKRDYVISDKYERTHEYIRTLEEIMDRDKGGMIMSPKIGLHENIAVLDYNDEFANIILNNNISYEAVNSESQIDESVEGILPSIVRQLLDLRAYYKDRLKHLDEDTDERVSYIKRYDTLKKILVCLYGTTGSYWNKYGNVLAFEEINRKSREILLKTKDIVQSLGFELIYADTDSAFVHKNNATRADYETVRQKVSAETGLSVSLQYHYKFLVLLPLEADEKLEALKHYFGITNERELVMRGIETRRHDTPPFIIEYQNELLYTLFNCDTSDQIYNNTLENALLYVTRTIDKVMTGEVKLQDLVITKQLRLDITKYKSLFPHVSAAMQLSIVNGKCPKRGDNIQYVYINSQHQNPLNRVTTRFDDSDEVTYDKEKYKDMLLDATETVLGIFGFDRTLYGERKSKKWWEELRKSKLQDIQAEINS
jgi:DNA polymerase elongation subunit (family B)